MRGDTLYDFTIPDDAKIIDCESPSAPHGVFRSNKIIITNSRTVPDEMAMAFYYKSNLPEKSYFKAMAGCAVRGYMKTVIKIFEDKVNIDNINLALSEFKDFCKPKEIENFDDKMHLSKNTKLIYDKFMIEMKNRI